MKAFTAIDFETARGSHPSICQVGLVRVQEGIITDEVSILVQPPENAYWHWLTKNIHGITPEKTKDAPTFDKVWQEIAPLIQGQHVVAHNGFVFDFPVLERTLAHYGMRVPHYEKYCTYRLFKKDLASLCQEYNIPLRHHEALSDAKASAALFLIHLERQKNRKK